MDVKPYGWTESGDKDGTCFLGVMGRESRMKGRWRKPGV
jgi:hypothetical protein